MFICVFKLSVDIFAVFLRSWGWWCDVYLYTGLHTYGIQLLLPHLLSFCMCLVCQHVVSATFGA